MLTQPAPLSAQPRPIGFAMSLSTMASGVRQALAQAFVSQTTSSVMREQREPDACDLPALATARAKRLMRSPD